MTSHSPQSLASLVRAEELNDGPPADGATDGAANAGSTTPATDHQKIDQETGIFRYKLEESQPGFNCFGSG